MLQPKVSIITITYNSSKTLQKTIDSYNSQNYPNKELIIIDGGSKDKTKEIIIKNSHCINYWISEPDNGIPDALNKGMKAASGEWFYFLNSDDTFYDYNTLTNVFSKNYLGYSMIYGNVILKSNGKCYNGEYNINKLFTSNICHQAQFFHKQTIETVGIYNIKYRYLSDYDYTLRIFSDKNLQSIYIPLTIAEFDDSGRTSFMHDKEFWKDRKKNFIDRFKKHYKLSQIAEAYMPYFTYLTQQGSLVKAIAIMVEMFVLTKNKKWIFDGLKNFKDRLLSN